MLFFCLFFQNESKTHISLDVTVDTFYRSRLMMNLPKNLFNLLSSESLLYPTTMKLMICLNNLQFDEEHVVLLGKGPLVLHMYISISDPVSFRKSCKEHISSVQTVALTRILTCVCHNHIYYIHIYFVKIFLFFFLNLAMFFFFNPTAER